MNRILMLLAFCMIALCACDDSETVTVTGRQGDSISITTPNGSKATIDGRYVDGDKDLRVGDCIRIGTFTDKKVPCK
jgi:hypothetical protein